MGKHLVVVEATTSGAGLRILDSAYRLGIKVTFISKDPLKYQRYDHNGIFEKISSVIKVDQVNKESLLSIIDTLNKLTPVQGLVCLTDGSIEVVSEVAAHYGLDFVSPQAVSLARNKEQTRDICSIEGIAVPQYKVVRSIEEATEVAKIFKYPCVLKSSRGTGSSQVQLCSNELELCATYPIIMEKAHLTSGVVLLEEFLRGPLFSVESITSKGKTHILGITDRLLGPLPHFVEISYSFPVQLDSKTEEEIHKIVIKLIEAIGVENGITHTELILTNQGPSIVEINPRLGGGMLGPMISESYGFDIYEQIIKLAFGMEPHVPKDPIGGASTYIIYPNKVGVLEEVNEDIAKTYPGVRDIVISSKSGDYVKPPQDFQGDIGYVWATGKTVNMATSFCQTAASAITYKVIQ